MSSQWMGQHGSQPANAGQIPVVTSILKDFSAEALGELRTWLEQNPPAVTIQSIIGFSQFTAQFASVATQENCSSTTYTDLATTGPTISGLPNGKFLLLYGVGTSGAVTGLMSPSVNGATPSDAEALQTIATAGTLVPGAFPSLHTLSGGSNTVTMQYRVGSAGTDSFANRWLIALRYSNL